MTPPMTRCDSCEQPIEADVPALRQQSIYIDRRGRTVTDSTLATGAQIEITLKGAVHDQCVQPRIEALIEQALDGAVTA